MKLDRVKRALNRPIRMDKVEKAGFIIPGILMMLLSVVVILCHVYVEGILLFLFGAVFVMMAASSEDY